MSRILLVEDSRVQAIVSKRMLEKAGYDVDHAETAETAVKSCYERTPELLVLDQNLAEISGLEVCRRVKNDPSLSTIPVLVLTASDRERDHVAALDAGADAFLSKGTAKQNLLAVVRRLIESTTSIRRLEDSQRPQVMQQTRVLAVDDSPTFREALCKKLTEAGFDVDSASSGQEVLDKLRASPVEIAVTDIVMPEMDGFEFCAAAREWADESRMQLGLLVLTGSDRKDVLVQSLEAGADDYVNKAQDLDVIVSHATALARRVARMRHLEAAHEKSLKQDAALREAELQRQQAEERATMAKVLEETNAALEESNQQLSHFASVASHDLQVPLRRILGFCDLLERKASDKLDEECSSFLEFITTSARGMQRLISDLLTFSRVDTADAPFEPTDVNTVLAKVKENLEVAIQESSAKITHDPLPTLPARRTQLVQLFQNLVGNAIHYRGEEPPTIHVTAERHEESWRFEIRDNGLGIPAEHQASVFQMFRRLHSDDQKQGTGIGLATCRKIVEQHQGQIGVTSEVGQGSTFYFTLAADGTDNS